MGHAQRRHLHSVAAIVEEAARIHDEAVARTNECVLAANKATEDVAQLAGDVDALRKIVNDLRDEHGRRFDAQGRMVVALEQQVLGVQREQRSFALDSDVESLKASVPALGAHRVLAERFAESQRRVVAFRDMGFFARLAWLLFGRAPQFDAITLDGSMVSDETSERGTPHPHETLPPTLPIPGAHA